MVILNWLRVVIFTGVSTIDRLKELSLIVGILDLIQEILERDSAYYDLEKNLPNELKDILTKLK